jgi:hypothetical protein
VGAAAALTVSRSMRTMALLSLSTLDIDSLRMPVERDQRPLWLCFGRLRCITGSGHGLRVESCCWESGVIILVCLVEERLVGAHYGRKPDVSPVSPRRSLQIVFVDVCGMETDVRWVVCSEML